MLPVYLCSRHYEPSFSVTSLACKRIIPADTCTLTTHSRSRTHTRTHARTHAHAHARAHTHTQTHTHTHKHTHTNDMAHTCTSGTQLIKGLVLVSTLTSSYLCHYNSPKFLTELKDATTGRFAKLTYSAFTLAFLLNAVFMVHTRALQDYIPIFYRIAYLYFTGLHTYILQDHIFYRITYLYFTGLHTYILQD